jgi:4-amino-4-deoxy-L-arabinose transferase-like glycosyltransferase
MSRLAALLMVTAVWAAIYLPALGSLEIKGEEGRRILPAVTMLESGNYIVPRVGSAAYFSKPPLINWLVAASFKIFGQRNEWTARLPSAFCVLAVAVALVTVARASLRPTGSVLAGLIWLTNFGIIEKGRLIEIEALYVSLCGLAIIFWLSFWEQNKSPWLVWIPASIFLGLGLLTKGPMHLLFFYAVVLSVVWQAKDARIFFHPAHLVGIAVMLGIFAAWAIPFAQSTTVKLAMFKWSRQFSGRLRGEDFKFSSWILNLPRSLAYFLPWLLLLPCLPHAKFSSERKLDIVRGLSWGIAIPLLIVDLFPGSLPRYTMPLLAPACVLCAAVLTAEEVTWPKLFGGRKVSARDRQRIVAAVVIITCVCISAYAAVLVPKLRARQKVKSIAVQIDAAVPRGELVYALDPDYQPFLFYTQSKLVYVSEITDLPLDADYVLVQPEKEKEVEESVRWAPRRAHRVLAPLTDYRHRSIILLKID